MPRHFRRLALTACVLLTAGASTSLGQGAGQRPAQPDLPGGSSHAAVVSFADDPLRIDQLGYTLRIPAGSVARASSVGDRKTVQIVPKDSDQLVNDKAWLINVTTPVTANPSTTIADSIRQIVSLLESAYGVQDSQGNLVRTDAEVIHRIDKLVINGQPAGRVYVRVPGQKEVKVVKGYTIFNPASKQFLILELVTPDAAFSRVRGTYETIVATSSFKDSDAVNQERALAVDTTQQLLEQLTPAEYLGVMGDGSDEIWQRLYIPAPSGDDAEAQELGYRGIKFWRGQRGEINPDLPKQRWTDAEKQDGYLARLSIRLIDESALGPQVGRGNAVPAVFIDSVGLYFMTPDRKEEAWSVRLVKRDAAGNELARWTETAARIGNEVTVAVGDPKDRTRPIIAPFKPEGYVCQLETFLLPTLLVKHGIRNNLPGFEAGTYSYRSDGESVAFRRDIVSRDAGGSGWSITTRVRDEPVSQTYIYDSKGRHVRTELGEGRVWEPIDIGVLFKLWQDKRLPTQTAGGAKRKR